MTLKEYAQKINELAEKHPDALVVYAIDDEGNAFHPVRTVGALGFYNANYQQFVCEEHVIKYPKEETYEPYVGKKPDTICIN